MVITQKVQKQKLLFLYVTHRHYLLYTIVKYHDYIPKGIQVTERTQNCIKKQQREDNSKSVKGRALIFVRDTSSWPVLYNCEVSSKYSKWFSSYRTDTKMLTDGQMDGRTPGSSLYPPNLSVGGQLVLKCSNASKRCRWNGKQCRPSSDCSSRSSLIRAWNVCSDFSVPIMRIFHNTLQPYCREYARGRRERRNRFRSADVAFFSSESDKNVALISRKIRCLNIHFSIHTCHQLVFDLGRSSTRYPAGLHKKSIRGRGPVWEGSWCFPVKN